MSKTLLPALLAALAPALHAQDSTSQVNTPPGDALWSRDTAEQINDFVVDLAAGTSTWGNAFGVGPIIKASSERLTTPTFFNAQLSAQAMSTRLRAGTPFVRSSYSHWTAHGFGINDNATLNSPGTPINTTGFNGYQFGACFAEFSSGTTDPAGNLASLNQVIGSLVNFTDARPSRLYVTRVMAAVNGPSESCNVSQFGLGACDEDGNVHFRCDGFGSNASCGGFAAIGGDNYFRVDLLNRAGASLNVISSTGATDAAATNWVLAGATTTHNVPNMVPESLAGRPIMLGLNFLIQYLYESAANVMTAAAAGTHLAPGPTDHRGAMGYTPHAFTGLFGAGATLGVAGQLGQPSGTGPTYLNLIGIGANGVNAASIARQLPAAPVDPIDAAFNPTALTGVIDFNHYRGVVAFRGNSQVAVGRDQAGRLLAAATAYYGYTNTNSLPQYANRNNFIPVARIDPVSGATTWSVAAWTQGPNTNNPAAAADGKALYQNGTTVIGRLTGGFATPAISGPMIDSVGNVWFISSIEIFGTPNVLSVGLVRAVYDPATFSYKLELVFKEGDVYPGLNSGRNWQIRFLQVGITNGAVAPGTAWSNNISSASDRLVSTVGMPTSDPRTLGGMVIHASIIYDINQDAQFIRQVGTGGDPSSPDQDYEVLLYVGASRDCNTNGIPDDSEIADGLVQDANGNGIPDTCEGIAGLAMCFPGQGGVSPCLCGNPNGAGRGCSNTGSTGGILSSSGLPSLFADSVDPGSVVLTGTSMLSGSTCIFLQGNALLTTGVPFGAGIRCAGGSLKRLYTKSLVGLGGTKAAPEAADRSVSNRSSDLGDPIAPASMRWYQTYYRDPFLANPGPPCPTIATFNITSGQEITWGP